MSTTDSPAGGHSTTDTVAGFLAVASAVLSALALGGGILLEVDARPARTAAVAALLALVAAGMSARYQSLALKAVFFACFAWVVGLTIAVLTENPLI